jgi:hypothetical protein
MSGQIRLAARLGDVAAQDNADLRKGAVQAFRQATHSGCSCERNQSKNQKVFNQALASFIVVQSGKGLQHKSHHKCGLLRIFRVRSQRVLGGRDGPCCRIYVGKSVAKACAGLRIVRREAMSLKAIAFRDCFPPEFGIKSRGESRLDAGDFPLATLRMLIYPKMDTFVYSRANDATRPSQHT